MYFLTFFFSTVLCVEFFLDLHGFFILTSFLLLFFHLFIVCDLYFFARQIKVVGSGRSIRCTSVLDTIYNGYDLLRRRNNLLEVIAYKDHEMPLRTGSRSLDDVFSQSVSNSARSYRSGNVTVVLCSRGKTSVFQDVSPKLRIPSEKDFLDYVGNFLPAGSGRVWLDTISSEYLGICQKFSLYGVSSILRAKVEWQSLETTSSAEVCVLYREGQYPSSLEFMRLGEFICGLKKQGEVFERIEQLYTEVEAQRMLTREKQEALSSFSHDLRTPLNNIHSAMSLLDTHCEDSVSRPLLEVGIANYFRLESLMSKVEEFAKVQSARSIPQRELFDINLLLEEIESLFSFQSSEKGIHLEISYSDKVESVFADRFDYSRIVSNLLGNAIKYTEQGSILVSFSKENGNTTLSISDTGEGISEYDSKKIWEPFYRCNSQEVEGSGIGLALVKSLVERNNGKITLSSVPGEGSTFSVSFPSNFSLSMGKNSALSVSSDFSVLIIEDDIDYGSLLKETFSEFYGRVDVVSSFSEALRAFDEGVFDLVISDYQINTETLYQNIKYVPKDSTLVVLSGASEVHEEVKERAEMLRRKPCCIRSLAREIAETKHRKALT